MRRGDERGGGEYRERDGSSSETRSQARNAGDNHAPLSQGRENDSVFVLAFSDTSAIVSSKRIPPLVIAVAMRDSFPFFL